MDWAYLLTTLWVYAAMFGAAGIVCAIVASGLNRE